MKVLHWVVPAVIPFLFACLPKKPDVTLTEAPAGPLVQALEQHARAFSTLKAIGAIRVERKDRSRFFDNAGILVNGQEQFRIEAYSPLGQVLLTVLWDGSDILLDLGGERKSSRPGSSGLERILGAELDPAELCAVLSGNVPGILRDPRHRLLCAPNGSCVLELDLDNALVKVYPPLGWDPALSLPSYEVFRNDRLVYRVRYESFERISGYLLPRKIILDNRDRRVTVTVEYAEAEINVPVSERAFRIDESGDRE